MRRCASTSWASRGVDREPAARADMAAMARWWSRASTAGALGFTTSRSLFHAGVRRDTLRPPLPPPRRSWPRSPAACARGQGCDPAPGRLPGRHSELDRVRHAAAVWSRSPAGRFPSPCSTSRSIPAAGRRSLGGRTRQPRRPADQGPGGGAAGGDPLRTGAVVPSVLDLPELPRDRGACRWGPSWPAPARSGDARRGSVGRSRSAAIPTCWPSMRSVANMFVLGDPPNYTPPAASGWMRGLPLSASTPPGARLRPAGVGRWPHHPVPSLAPITPTAPTPTWRACCATRTP